MRRDMLVIAAAAALWLGVAPAARAQIGISVGYPTYSYSSYGSPIGFGAPWGVRSYGVGVGTPFVNYGYGPTWGYGTTVYNSGYSGYAVPGSTFVTTGGYAPFYSPYGYGTRLGYGAYGVPGVGFGRVGGFGMGRPFLGIGGFR